MSMTMETKEKILNRLREGRSTVTELSNELNLTKAAISQHLSKLESMGAVESHVDPHFRNLKYFELNPQFDATTIKARRYTAYQKLAAVLVILAVGILALGMVSRPTGIISTIPPAPNTSKPFITLSFVNSTGFAVYNYSAYNRPPSYRDFVLPPGSNGTITYTLAMTSAVAYNVVEEVWDNATNPPTLESSNTTRVVMTEFNVTNLIWITGAQPPNGTNSTGAPTATNTVVMPTTTVIIPPPIGISLSLTPNNETLILNRSAVTVTAHISIAANAPTDTYWLVFAPGPADSSNAIAMLTVGTAPYKGLTVGFGAGEPNWWTPP